MHIAKRKLLTLASLALTFLVTAHAQAALITRNVQFTATDIQIFAGPGPVPVDPVIGEFVITYDPTVAYVDNTSNISLVSLNIALGSPLAFSYDPAVSAFAPAGRLRVGGVVGADAMGTGADRVPFNPGSNDFWLYIDDFATSPTFVQLGYSELAAGPRLYGTIADDATGGVAVTTPTAAAVPEPTSLAVFGIAMAASALGSRKWKKARSG